MIKYDRPDWILQKDKYTRYKITNIRNYEHSSGRFLHSGKCYFIYDYGDSLTFKRLSYETSSGKIIHSELSFNLRVKNGKINAYYFTGKAVRNISYKIGRYIDDYERLKGVHLERVKCILFSFLERHNFEFDKNSTFKIILLKLFYPFVKIARLDTVLDLRPTVTKLLKETSLKKIAKIATGSSGNSTCKLLASLYKNGNFNFLSHCLVLKGLVPIDYISELINNYPIGFDLSVQDYKNLFVNYNHKRIKTIYRPNIYLDDTVRLFKQYPFVSLPKKPKSIKEVHDHILKNIDKQFDGQEIWYSIPQQIKKIDSLQVGGKTIVVANSNKVLHTAGEQMGNCLFSYSDLVAAGATYIILFKDGKNEFCDALALSHGQITRFKSKYNQDVDPTFENDVKKFLIDNNLIYEDNKV